MFSKSQIKNWQVYERIRQGGMFNMFDPRARAMTTMSVAEWVYCMEHYDAIKKACDFDAQALAHEAQQNCK
jgi:hypothetical protein